MSYNMDDFFHGKTGNGMSNFTIEEIEAAKKRQKKHGGTFLENLEKVAPGKRTAAASMDFNSLKNGSSPSGAAPSIDDITASIQKLNASIARDFAQLNSEVAAQTSAVQDLYPASSAPDAVINSQATSEPTAEELTPDSAFEKFAGVTDVLKEKVFGQDDFLKKLNIAFKRPFVSERDDNDALNSIYINGPACTGKHYALTTLIDELANRKLLKNNHITTMNLSLYPTSTEEKLFLQDLYSALQRDSQVIVFENYENCHISMLTRISDLVSTGECKLSERYVMQNGQLINVSNAFAGNTVGSFEAKGKYLVFISTRNVEKLANVMGAPFINSLGDICTSSELSTEAIQQVADIHEKQLIEKGKKQLGLDLTMEDSFKEYCVAQTSKGRGLKGVLNTYGDTLRALSELRLEKDDLASAVTLKTNEDGSPVFVTGEEELLLSNYLPNSYSGELESVKAEMETIVGLKEVKEYINGLEEYFGVQKRRREAGLKAGEVNKHMIFTGNPGTGKTTIARIVSKYLKAIGVLSGGQLVEVSRADLVGRYVGHTAPLVNQVIKSALGGVLFIDEAYSLHRGKDDNFGLEAIDTLVKGIEDNRDDLIVILAGYSKEMEEFLESNSGLKSRFPNIIDFPDYTGEELLAIAKLTAKGKGYAIDEEAEKPLLDFFNYVQATRAMDAGNGRLVRNKIEEAILNQSRRLVAEPDADMSLLVEMDFALDE